MDKEIFVKIEEYDDIKDILRLITNKINDAKKTLDKVQEFRAREAEELTNWKTEIDTVESKVGFISSNIVGLGE